MPDNTINVSDSVSIDIDDNDSIDIIIIISSSSSIIIGSTRRGATRDANRSPLYIFSRVICIRIYIHKHSIQTKQRTTLYIYIYILRTVIHEDR